MQLLKDGCSSKMQSRKQFLRNSFGHGLHVLRDFHLQQRRLTSILAQCGKPSQKHLIWGWCTGPKQIVVAQSWHDVFGVQDISLKSHPTQDENTTVWMRSELHHMWSFAVLDDGDASRCRSKLVETINRSLYLQTQKNIYKEFTKKTIWQLFCLVLIPISELGIQQFMRPYEMNSSQFVDNTSGPPGGVPATLAVARCLPLGRNEKQYHGVQKIKQV